MLHYEPGLVEEALSRYSPAVIAITTETRDLVDVGPILQYLARDSVAWKAIHVLDRVDVCQWFVQHTTDAANASVAAEVRSQLLDGVQAVASANDGMLCAMCLKYRIIAIAVARERERRAAIAAADAEYAELVAQLVEDGMNEADAKLEAQRTLDESADDAEDEELPPVRDIVLIKGFPHHINDVLSLVRMGIPLSAILIVNSLARFGRKDELSLEAKDGKSIAKKRPDIRKPDNKKGRGGRDDVDRLEPLTVQITKELGRLDPFEPTPLRDILLWSYAIPCSEGPLQDDGSRAFSSKETESVSCERVVSSFFSIVEKVYRYREWALAKSHVRVPKLRTKEPVEQVRVVLPSPAPTPAQATKNAKKPKTRSDPEPVKEEVVAPAPVMDICESVADLPTNLALVDTLLDSATPEAFCAAAEIAVFGSLLQATASLSDMLTVDARRGSGRQKKSSVSESIAAEVNAMSFMDELLSDSRTSQGGAGLHLNDLFIQRASECDTLVAAMPCWRQREPIRAAGEILEVVQSPPIDFGSVVGVSASGIVRSLRSRVAQSLFGRDALPNRDETVGSVLGSIGGALNDRDLKSCLALEVFSESQVADHLFSDSARSDVEGYEMLAYHNTNINHKNDGHSGGPLKVFAKRGASVNGQDKFRKSWFLFQGRIPFPVWSAMEDVHDQERAHYFPPMNDDADSEDIEEEEEEEDTFDDEGNLLPKKVRTYPIVFRNHSQIASDLVRRRAVYESLSSFLRCTVSEQQLVSAGGSSSLDDEHTSLFPDDGSMISVHCIRGNTEQRSCVVHAPTGDCAFGFHTQPQAPRGSPLVSSRVRPFFNTCFGLRLSVETFVEDAFPPQLAKIDSCAEVQAPATAPPVVPPTTSVPGNLKRSNTPRSNGRQPAPAPMVAPVVTPVMEDLAAPSQFQRPVTAEPAEPSFSVVSVSMDRLGRLELRRADTSIVLATPIHFKATVAGPMGVQEVQDSYASIVINGFEQSIMLVGAVCRLKLFASGDIASCYKGHWLLTAVGTGNRLLRGDGGIHAVAPVLMATTILDGATTITRDDGVVIQSSPAILITLPGGVSLLKRIGCEESTFVLPEDTRVIFKPERFDISFAENRCSLQVLCREGRFGIGYSCDAPRVAFDFNTHLMYVMPTRDGHVYTVDGAFGGMRVHDGKDAFHVTPFGRCRHVSRDLEEAPLPSNLTIKHVVDLFVEEPEVISPLFEATSALSGRGVKTSLHALALLPTIPSDIMLFFRTDLTRAPSLPKSVYVREKAANFYDRLDAFETALGSPTQTRHAPTTVYSLYSDPGIGNGALMGWATCPSSQIHSCASFARQCDVIRSDVVTRLVGGGSAAEVVCCPGERQTAVARTFYLSPLNLGLRLPLSDLSATMTTVVDNIPRVLRAQLDFSLGSLVPAHARAIADIRADRCSSASWPQPVASLHADLAALKCQEPRYWLARALHSTDESPPPVVRAVAKMPEADKTFGGGCTATAPPRIPLDVSPPRVRPEVARPHKSLSTNSQPPNEPSRRISRKALVPTPSVLCLGPVMERFRYGALVQLTNISTSVCRFRVTCSAAWIGLQYKMIPLASGITTVLEVELNGTQPVGSLSTELVVAFEGGGFVIPISTDCYPASSKVIVPPSSILRILGPL